MTNANCCEAGCGFEYCGAENNVDFSTYFWAGFVILTIVLLAVANANLVPATGIEILDGSTYIDL